MTVSQPIDVRICLHAFYVTQYQVKRLNGALEFTLTSSLTSKRNMKKFSFLPNSSPVQAYRPLQAKFYKTFKHFQNQRGSNSATMHVKNSGWSMSNFQDYRKSEIQRRHSIAFYSPVVRMSNKVFKDNHFVSLKRMKTTENAADTNCFTD